MNPDALDRPGAVIRVWSLAAQEETLIALRALGGARR